MRHLLDFGAEVNAVDSNGISPLIIAAGTQYVKGVELLLQRNADRYLKSKTGYESFGRSANALYVASYEPKNSSLPMHAAARLGRTEFFHALYKPNEPAPMQADAADVHAIRPLHIAAYYNRAAFASELIRVGADVDAQATAQRRSPLTIAALRSIFLFRSLSLFVYCFVWLKQMLAYRKR
jgi:ankyrin repeat protein